MSEENFESEARTLGWVPQEQFRGDQDKWVDAKTFVERGQQQLPILRENNRRLQGTVESLKGQVSHLQTLFEASQESITELKRYHDETFTARVDAEKARLRSEIEAARESGDVKAELESQEKLWGLSKEAKQVEKEAKSPAPATKPEPKDQPLTPEFLAWKGANGWFETDRKKTILAMALAQEVSLAQPGLKGKAFFDALDAEIEAVSPSRPSGSKVEGSRGGSSSGGGGGGSAYADLPADAKAQCDKDARKFVGEGRAFKTATEWQKHYASLYFEKE